MEILTDIMNTEPLFAGIIIFFLGLLTDYVWCKWIYNVSKKNAFLAANWSLIIGMVGLISTSVIIANNWFLFFVFMIGCYFGTYTSVKFGNKNE